MQNKLLRPPPSNAMTMDGLLLLLSLVKMIRATPTAPKQRDECKFDPIRFKEVIVKEKHLQLPEVIGCRNWVRIRVMIC